MLKLKMSRKESITLTFGEHKATIHYIREEGASYVAIDAPREIRIIRDRAPKKPKYNETDDSRGNQ